MSIYLSLGYKDWHELKKMKINIKFDCRTTAKRKGLRLFLLYFMAELCMSAPQVLRIGKLDTVLRFVMLFHCLLTCEVTHFKYARACMDTSLHMDLVAIIWQF